MDIQGIEPWTSRKFHTMRSVRATTVPNALTESYLIADLSKLKCLSALRVVVASDWRRRYAQLELNPLPYARLLAVPLLRLCKTRPYVRWYALL